MVVLVVVNSGTRHEGTWTNGCGDSTIGRGSIEPEDSKLDKFYNQGFGHTLVREGMANGSNSFLDDPDPSSNSWNMLIGSSNVQVNAM